MPDLTSRSVNFIALQAGFPQFELTGCPPAGPCTWRRWDNPDSATRRVISEGQYQNAGEVFGALNDTLAGAPGEAPNRGANSSPLFQPLGHDWVFVDADSVPGPESVLRRTEEGWTLYTAGPGLGDVDRDLLAKLLDQGARMLEARGDYRPLTEVLQGDLPLIGLIRFLATQSWEDLGLKASPEGFKNDQFAFVVVPSGDDGDPSSKICGPFHAAYLQWLESGVPWTDPYLLLEWEAFLEGAGVSIERKAPAQGQESGFVPLYNTSYVYKGFLLFESTQQGGEVTFSHFSPFGEVLKTTTVPFRPKPPVTVVFPKEGGPPETHFVSVYGRQVPVFAFFSVPEMTQGEKWQVLNAIGEGLQRIPESIIVPILTGREEEIPLRILLATEEKARELKWYWGDRHAAGGYNSLGNGAWLDVNRPLGWFPGAVTHEVGGHAFDDTALSSDNMGYLTQPGNSALGLYFVWKLARRILPHQVESTKAGRVEKKILEAAAKDFVSAYALQGPRGLRVHLQSPYENFAEVAEDFYSHHLTGRSDLATGAKSWRMAREEEPLLKILGANYLFHEYPGYEDWMAGIWKGEDAVRPGELFQASGFRKVAGVDLTGMEGLAQEFLQALQETEERRHLAGPERRGLHGDLLVEAGVAFNDAAPYLGIGLEAEYVDEKELSRDSNLITVPHLRYVLLDLTSGRPVDALAFGVRYYLPSFGFGFDLGLGPVALQSGNSATGFLRLSAQWLFTPLGRPVEVGPFAGFLAPVGSDSDGETRPMIGLSVVAP